MELFRSAWQDAADVKVPARAVLRYHELLYPTLSDGELRQLEERVAGKPDHPDRRTLDAEKRRRAKGPDRIDYQVWFQQSGAWRYNMTDHAEGFYVDQAVTPQIVWSLVPKTLTVIDPGTSPPPNKDYAVSEDDFTTMFRRLAWARMPGPPSVNMQLQDATIRNGRWTGVASAAGWSTRRWTGYYDDEAGRLILEETVLVESPKFPEARGKSERYSGWSFIELLGQWTARRIEERSADGRVQRVIEFDGAEPLDDDTFAELTAIPPSAGTDPIRGATTFTSIIDYRPRAEKITTFTPNGTVETPLPASSLGRSRSHSLRVAGWVLAGAILVALVAIRLWRVRSSRA
jgi:hypothetical protein